MSNITLNNLADATDRPVTVIIHYLGNARDATASRINIRSINCENNMTTHARTHARTDRAHSSHATAREKGQERPERRGHREASLYGEALCFIEAAHRRHIRIQITPSCLRSLRLFIQLLKLH